MHRLVASGVDVTGAARRPAPPELAGVRWIAGDVGDAGYVTGLVADAKADVIFHLAGEVSGSRSLSAVQPTLRTNLVGSVNVLQAATEFGCERLVLLGSGDEPVGGAAPCSPYAAAKSAQTSYARMFHERYETPVTIARVFMAYGPEQPDEAKIVPYSVLSLLHGERPALSSGRRRCDWIYIDDVVDALLTLATSPAPIGHVVDVGTGVLHTVRDVVDTIVELTGAAVEPAWGALPDREGETEDVADAAESTRQCGWSAHTDLRSGLEQTVSWYRHRRTE